jgi:general secretion pathway protein D
MPRTRDAALALVLSLALTGPLAARQVTQVPGGIVLNFRSVELIQVFEALAQAIYINIVLTDIPSKPITLRTPQAVSVAEVRSLIRSLAEVNGIAITEGTGFLRLHGRSAEAAQADLRELYIYRLRHARAGVLAGTLQALFGATPTGGTGAAGASSGPGTLSQRLQAFEQQSAAAAAPQVITQPGGAVLIQARPGSGDLQAPVYIVPDEVTNALLIRATPTDWLVIQQALQQLDLRPLQVVIEVVIAEVSRTEDLDVGVSSTLQRAGAAPGNTTEARIERETPAGGFALRIVRAGTVDIDATLSMLATSGRVRIVSRPVIHAQNNQEAYILVGSQRPFIAVSRSLPNDATRDDVVQYLSVGTVLNILPTINEDGYVNLTVSQEVSNATNETQFGAPVISTREAVTQLLVRNGQTAVIGGLVDRQIERVRGGIPLLSRIPVLGGLFGFTREFTGSSELFLFLTPYIVFDDEDLERVREEIEQRARLLEDIVPIEPILPPVPPDGLDGVGAPDGLDPPSAPGGTP